MTDKTRRERTPFSANRRRLHVDEKFKEKGFFYRFFNDQDGRIQRALDAGYEKVLRGDIAVGDKEVGRGNTDLNSHVSTVVGRDAQGQSIRAYFMRIPLEWYEEDQAKKEATNRMVDDAIRAGKAGGASINNQYGEVDLQRKELPA